MNRPVHGLLLVVLALALSGCVSYPRENLRLAEARAAHARLPAEVARLAPAESARAAEALERAALTWSSREDPALVDHLAYVARQRAAIAEQVARRVAAELALAERYRQTSARP
jgi:uncharacterized protein DUF4398